MQPDPDQHGDREGKQHDESKQQADRRLVVLVPSYREHASVSTDARISGWADS